MADTLTTQGDAARAAASPGKQTMSIELDKVTKSFRGNEVLHGITFSAQPGEFIALVGPSGAGKSTLLRLLNGIHTPTTGSVRVLGTNPAECSRRELQRLRSRVGFIFQQFGLVGRVSALENVLMGALSQLHGPRYGISTYPKHLRERAVQMLDRVNLGEYRFQRCDTLSGGQQQRVAIARTLMQNAEVVLADEPVASLDPSASVAVLDMLRRLSREDGFTVVCSLHQVEYALDVSDRVLAVREGRVILDRPTAETTSNDIHSVYRRADGASA
jgi:phosphonate transport system ATP-binding protein